MALGIFSLTVYLIIGALASGYLFAFLQDVPLTPGDYFKQIAEALGWLDFALLALKTMAFGFFIAIVTCYHGLAQPLRLEDVSRVAVRAVTPVEGRRRPLPLTEGLIQQWGEGEWLNCHVCGSAGGRGSTFRRTFGQAPSPTPVPDHCKVNSDAKSFTPSTRTGAKA
jgi:hypothetical protein